MRRTERPPLIANWILEHLTPGDRNDALTGDLLEEFRGGRTAGWYWRQVLTTIAIRCFSEIRAHSLALVFAAVWSIPVRAWWFFALWYAAHSVGYILPTPYSTYLGMCISVVLTLWIGLAAYVLINSLTVHSFDLKGIVRGLCAGPVVFLFLTVLLKISWPHPTVIHQYGCCQFVAHKGVASFGAVEVLAYFLSLATAAWRIRSRSPMQKVLVCLVVLASLSGRTLQAQSPSPQLAPTGIRK